MNHEHVVARTDELADGQMKEVQLQDRSILLVRIDGAYKAYLPECPHHGAPLADGVICQGHLRCPWHQAVFDLRNGELLEPPALDRLPHYEVRTEGDKVIVVVPTETAVKPRPPAMASEGESDERTFVILGTGAAGISAAQTLRSEGFAGRVVMVTRESALPYDRTALSKSYLSKADAAAPQLRDEAFFNENGIGVLTGQEVSAVDRQAKTVQFIDAEPLAYDRLLIATGSYPRRLNLPGEDLENVLTLRSLADCRKLRDLAGSNPKVVLIGASFIAMEAAASLTQRGLEVHVVAPESVPFQATLGERIGQMYRDVHEEKGVTFHLGDKPQRYLGSDGAVRAVELASGQQIAADGVLVGVGVQPATQFLEAFERLEDGSLLVDAGQRVDADVFAAGDVATVPDWRDGAPIRIEHWRVAMQQGQLAARNMLDRNHRYAGVPFFWTNQYFVITQFVGHVSGPCETVFDGDPADRQFVAYYAQDGQVRAAAGCQEDAKMALLAEQMRGGQAVTLEEARQQVQQAG